MFKSRAKQIKNARANLDPSTAATDAGAGGSVDSSGLKSARHHALPKLLDFVDKRDFQGAITLLEFQRHAKEIDDMTLPWLAYCYFHMGEFRKSHQVYNELLEEPEGDPVNNIYAACAMYALGMCKEATEYAKKGPTTHLQNRVLFQCAHKLGDEANLMSYHEKLSETVEDELCLAAIHFQRGHFQDATDTYKRLLIDHRDYLALQVYVAACYYQLDYYDVSLEILQPYLQAFPTSVTALNLKACNQYKIYDGKAAQAELKGLFDVMAKSSQKFENDLVRHNMAVFHSGENALSVWSPLIDVMPSARLNLVIYHLMNDEVGEAYSLIKDVDPSTPQEYILKGVVSAALGQNQDSREHLKRAQQFFQLVGASSSECDTIPGRQCMASCFFLLNQFEDVVVYMESIKQYFSGSDRFRYNFGVALASVGRFKDAEQSLLLVNNEKLTSNYAYISWLCRCYIMNGAAWEAWECYLKLETSSDSFSLLVLIANDCYKVGSFFYSAKAFDVLERLDPSPEYWEGKRGACCGVLQMVIAGKQMKERVLDVIALLRNHSGQQDGAGPEYAAEAEHIARIMKKYCMEHDIMGY